MSTRREIIDRGRLARLSRATDFYMNIPTIIESPLSYRIGGSPLVCQRHAPLQNATLRPTVIVLNFGP